MSGVSNMKFLRPIPNTGYSRELAELLLSKPSAVLAAGKKFFYRQIEMAMEPAYKLASQVITNNMLGQDALEGVGAFVEKRKPKWHDKDR